jgi:hypothetical protein
MFLAVSHGGLAAAKTNKTHPLERGLNTGEEKDMRKKDFVRRLELHRETLQKLTEGELEGVVGGKRTPSAATICDACTKELLVTD